MGILDRFKKKKDDKKVEPKKDSKIKLAKKDADKTKKTEYSSLKAKGEDTPVSGSKQKTTKTVKTKSTDTKDAYKVLIRPLITEKATDLAVLNKYCFEVSKRSNKIEIKKAIKSLYNVDAIDVNIIVNRGNAVRYGRISGKKKKWKKAIITLKKGEKIQLYEGV
jgi:large subunit ribosomal protein L23